MATRQTLWIAWGVGSLLWLAVSLATVGSGLGNAGYGEYATRSASLLSRPGCSRIADNDGALTCIDLAESSRERRAMLREAEVQQSAVAGSIVVGPPLAGMLLVWGIGQTLDRRVKTRRRPGRPPRR
jgi:hypothetical protein